MTLAILAILLAQPPQSQLARVTITGQAKMFVEARDVAVVVPADADLAKAVKDAARSVRGIAFQVGNSGVAIALPADKVEFEDVIKVMAGPGAVEGFLTTTDDPRFLSMAGEKVAKRVPLLVATRVVKIAAANRDKLPAVNQAWIEGVLKKGPMTVGKTSTDWSVRNGDSGLPFVALKGAELKDGMRVRVKGAVRVAEGQWLLEAAVVEPVKE